MSKSSTTNSLDPRIDYLVKPFMKLVNQKEFSNKRNTMHILRGVTGQGKTHTCIHDWIPTLLSKGIRLMVYSVPMNEIRQDDEFEIASLEYDVRPFVVRDEFDKAQHFLENTKHPIIFITTNQNWTGDKGRLFQDWAIDNLGNNKIAFFLDEAHTWLVSCHPNYRTVVGSSTPTYEAILFKQLSKLTEVTPYVFGITATPNSEMLGDIEPAPGMKFEIVNEMADKKLLISRTAWLNRLDHYEKGEEEFAFQQTIDDFMRKESENKPVMMIHVCREPNEWDVDNTLEYLKNYLEISGPFDKSQNQKLIVVLTDKKKFVTDINGNREALNDQTALKYLRDPKHPARFLIVVEKGKCGMNVQNLSSYFSFRFIDRKDLEGLYITTSFLQTAGRFVRPNVSKNYLDNNNDLTNFIRSVKEDTNYTKTQKKSIIDNVINTNSFDIHVPKTETWVESMRIFREDYCSSTRDARKWVKSI